MPKRTAQETRKSKLVSVALLVGVFGVLTGPCRAQMKTGSDMPGFRDAFALREGEAAKDYAVQEIEVHTGKQSMANVLWPGDSLEMTLRFTNNSDVPLNAEGKLEMIRYGTSVPVGDVWEPHVFRISDEGSIPISVKLPAHSSVNVTVQPPVPAAFGGYALITDLPGHGRVFAAAVARVMKPETGRVQFPTYALDTTWDEFMNEGVFVLFEKLGVKGMRMGAAFNPGATEEFRRSAATLDRYLTWARAHDVTVMLTLGDGDDRSMQPLHRPRPWLSQETKMLETKDDRAWLPSYDLDFQNWVESLTSKYGWPRGNVNAVELWNEPWEAVSISGWGADIPRYRDIYTHMAMGVEAARSKAGVKVLIGGTCSSTNTRDKLFPDGSDRYLKWLDFVSIHYQALAADPSLEPAWVHRKGPYGPVRVWDTESWIANSEDRIAGVIASMRAQGQSRTAGVFDGNVYESKNIKIEGQIYPVVQAWSPAAAVAATQEFIGQRNFNRLLFQNGLPWVFVFDGLPNQEGSNANPDDGTVVVVGDLKKIYEPDRTLFRSVTITDRASLTLTDSDGAIQTFDFYGNRLQAIGGKLSIPLNGLGYFLRTDGSPGSFQKLLHSLQRSQIDGIAPVEIVVRDFLLPIERHPTLRVKLTNVLNRPIQGKLSSKSQGLSLAPATIAATLAPNEAREFVFQVTEGKTSASNIYSTAVVFEAGVDGSSEIHEDLHVNAIPKRSISVDGNLADWQDVLPQILPTQGIRSSMTEEAWLPFKSFDKGADKIASVAYLAYDDANFYFAAKIQDSTLDPGMVRFSTRNDDAYFYPDVVLDPSGKELEWPEGVRHYSYRHNFDIPSGSEEHDNVQLAFNVLDKKPWLPHPPGVMPNFITAWDTDYEFALNPVAEAYGGGTEVWKLLAPGIPRKHFFPRQPKAPKDGGPVAAAKLVIRHEGNTRIVEAAIPWSEMPEVKQKLFAGESVKFSCRVNDNKGPAQELAAGRSVSKSNSVTFHDDWENHWLNELEFRLDK